MLLSDTTNFDVDVLFSDGMLLTWLHRIFVCKGRFTRASFDYSSVASEVFEMATEKKLSLALVGGKPSDINLAKSEILARHPGLDICFLSHGYFKNAEERSLVIDSVKCADVIVVGLGAPLQEKLCRDIKAVHKNGKLIFTCGGFLSQTAYQGDYYYPLIKRMGLRWLQRAVLHSHVRRRLIVEYPVFFLRYICQKLLWKVLSRKSHR